MSGCLGWGSPGCMNRDDRHPRMALPAWSLKDASFEEIKSGHINRTWSLVKADDRFILQWLNPIFDAKLHLDIEAITAKLASQGLTTPRLVPTGSGDLWAVDQDGGVWRLFTHIQGQTLLTADSAERCGEAGRLLGRFHRALWGFEHKFHFGRFGVHDTPKHLAALEKALETHAGHKNFEQVVTVASEIQADMPGSPEDVAGLIPRLVHGDPKISNVLFDPDGQAVCLVDLDTLAHMPIALELGDAFRSWCNPVGEDLQAGFRIDYFEAGLQGYAESIGDLPAPAEREAIPLMVQTICLELAARFCADALEESYFNWDRDRFESASAHNLNRARAQLTLARSVAKQRGAMERLVATAW